MLMACSALLQVWEVVTHEVPIRGNLRSVKVSISHLPRALPHSTRSF